MNNKILSIVAVVLLVPLTSVWAADLTGNWIARIPWSQGIVETAKVDGKIFTGRVITPVEIVFSFKADGEKLTGKVVTPEGDTAISDGKIDGDTKLYNIIENTLVEIEWPTESDMDDPATLEHFIQTVKNDYPSNYYALFIGSNKGSAWQGICYDEHGDGTMITMPEFHQILKTVTNNSSSKLDIISIETCMGGNTEIAYEIKEYCDYYLSSHFHIFGFENWTYKSGFIIGWFNSRYCSRWPLLSTAFSAVIRYF